MASNAAEREILFTELQVSGKGRRPSPASLPSWRGGRRSRRAPPPPARRSARDAHRRPGRPGGRRKPVPTPGLFPLFSSRSGGAAARSRPHPAAGRDPLLSALGSLLPRRAAASLRRGLPGPRPRPRPRRPGISLRPRPEPLRAPELSPAPSLGVRRSSGPGPEGSRWPPHARARVRRRASLCSGHGTAQEPEQLPSCRPGTLSLGRGENGALNVICHTARVLVTTKKQSQKTPQHC